MSKNKLYIVLIIAAIAYYYFLGSDAPTAQSAMTDFIETESPDGLRETDADGSITAFTSDGKPQRKFNFSDKHRPSRIGKNQIVRHQAYMLSYNEKHEQADWVFYLLTRAMVSGNKERNTEFLEDPLIKTESAITTDYSRSGYDRGHMCASADVQNDKEAQTETYYMSNMSPQLHDFNAGLWRELEEQVRYWAKKKDSIYVVTGPVLRDGLKKIDDIRSGRKTTRANFSGVSVPEQFYKVIYSPSDDGHMIAFLMENKAYDETQRPNMYIVSVDELEKVTGINFFPRVKNEDALEREPSNPSWWEGRNR